MCGLRTKSVDQHSASPIFYFSIIIMLFPLNGVSSPQLRSFSYLQLYLYIEYSISNTFSVVLSSLSLREYLLPTSFHLTSFSLSTCFTWSSFLTFLFLLSATFNSFLISHFLVQPLLVTPLVASGHLISTTSHTFYRECFPDERLVSQCV